MKRLLIIFYLLTFFTCTTDAMYICTAADYVYYPHLLNFIGSLHKENFKDLTKLIVFNLGLSKEQIHHLTSIEKLEIREVERKNPDILTRFKVHQNGKSVPGWYSWKPVVIKQALEVYSSILWIDAGATVLKSLKPLCNYIDEHGYFLTTIGDDNYNAETNRCVHTIASQTTDYVRKKFELDSHYKSILDKEAVTACVIGVSQKSKHEFIIPLYDLAADIRNFQDDGTAPRGFGGARYEQALLGIYAYQKELTVFRHAYKQDCPMNLTIQGELYPLYITWHSAYVDDRTTIYSSRWDLSRAHHFKSCIVYSKR